MKMDGKKLFLIVISLLLINFISATTCSPNSVTYDSGDSLTKTILCQSPNITGIQVFKGNYITLNSNTISPNESKTFIITITPPTTVGAYNSYVIFSDDGTQIPITLNIADSGGCQLNPSLASYTQTVQQGSELPLPKITFSPQNCNGNMIFD